MSVRPRKPVTTSLSNEAAYDTILRPIITEKATLANEHGQVTFAVPVTATKPQIKAAVEMLFDVQVTAVNTILLKGKTKMFLKYEHINVLVGAKAPKVTGMLIDLPIEDIKLIMQDWSLLQTRVQQASELLDNQAPQ